MSKRVREHFVNLVNLLCSEPANEFKIESLSKLRLGKEKGVLLTSEESKIFDQIIEELLNEPSAEYTSKRFLVDSLWDFVFDILKNREVFKDKKEIDIWIKNFFNRISKPLEDWIVLVPIPALKYDFKDLQIGNVKFYLFTESEIDKWGLFRKKSSETSKTYSKIFDVIINGFKDKICAEIRVKAIDAEKAIERGKLEIDSALHILRTYYGLRGRKAACEISEPLYAISRNLETGDERLSSASDWSWGCELKSQDEKSIKQFIGVFEQFHKKPEKERSKLDRRIIRSLRWCGMATQEKDLEDKILKYFTALECLLVTKDEGSNGKKGALLGKRISILLTPDEEKREEISRIIYNPAKDTGLYRIRSDIIHGSEYKVTGKDVKTLDYITRKTIAIISDEVQRGGFTKIKQVIDWIDNQKAT